MSGKNQAEPSLGLGVENDEVETFPSLREVEFFITLDDEGRIGGIPADARGVLGEALKDKVGRPLHKICSLRDAQRVATVVRAALKGKDTGPTPAEVTTPSGKKFECVIRFIPLSGAPGKTAGLIAAIRAGNKLPRNLECMSVQDMARLLDMAGSLNRHTDLDGLTRGLCRGAISLTGAEGAVIRLVDPLTGLLRMVRHEGMGDYPLPATVHEDDGLVGWVFRRRRAAMAGQNAEGAPSDDMATRMGCASYLHAPLVQGSVGLGVISVYAGQAGRFQETGLHLITGLAQIASAGIARTRALRDRDSMEQSTRMALEAAPVAILSMDGDGRVTHANPEFLRFIAGSADRPRDWLGRNLFSTELVAKNRLSHLLIELIRGKSFDKDFPEFFILGGTQEPLRLHGRVFREAKGRPTGAVLVFQKKTPVAQETIRDGRDWDFFEKSGDGIVIFSSRGKIIDLNDSAARIAGEKRANLIGRDLVRLFRRRRPPAAAATKGTRKEIAPSRQPAPVGATKRLLIAGVDESARKLFQRNLAAHGFEITIVADGMEAVETFKARKGAFDLVLLEMVMPRFNGESALRKIHAMAPETPVLLASEYADRFLAMEIPRGLSGYVEKPYDLPKLVETIRRVLKEE